MSGHDDIARQLVDLGLAVRAALLAARDAAADADALARPVAQEGGDTIFAIDRHVEPVIEQTLHDWPDAMKPLLLVAEGFGADGRVMIGGEEADAKWQLLVDPIDGTRNIMYDKRSAWFLAAIAPQPTAGGSAARLSDAIAAALVELPTSKQAWADELAATRDGPVVARRRHIADDTTQSLDTRPSTATTLRHGFAQVSNFFPGTKRLAADLMERIAEATLGDVQPGGADIFDDQYITTGGQFMELMIGHDRFNCDLRPLFYDIVGRQGGSAVRGLECHPYDVAAALVAKQAGVMLTDGFGHELDAPFDVHHGVHWVGYANATLREQIEPVLQAWLRDHGVRWS